MATGWWPPQVEFDGRDLATVADIYKKQGREQKRVRR